MINPFSKYGSSKSCLSLFIRCISSINITKLPYILAKLPRYDLNKYEGGGDLGLKEDGEATEKTGAEDDEYARLKEDGWRYIQETQDRLGALPYVYVVDSAGLGEGFDLHPQDKKPLGERYAEIILQFTAD